MQMIDADTPLNGPVSASFESCPEFRRATDASPVCEACGWLEDEHEPLAAEVLALPARAVARTLPKRLAS